MTLPRTLVDGPEVYVSWDGTAAFTGTYDNVSGDIDGDPGLVLSEGRDGAQQLSPPKVNAGSFELINDTAKYSQENAGSPVYQRVEPTKPVLYRAQHGDERNYDSDVDYDADVYYDGRVTFQLGEQMIDAIGERSAWDDRRVRIETIGHASVLTRGAVTVGVMTNPRVDQCFTALLDAAGWPANERRIAVSDTTLLYWWCDERAPWTAMLELLAAEGPGTFGVGRDGVFYFENRNFRTTEPRSAQSQAAIVDFDNNLLWFSDLTYDPGFKNIYNRATYSTKRRTLAALQKIWEYGTSLVLTANQSVTFIIRPSDGNPFQNAVTPVAATDYTVSAGSLASVTLSATSGLTAFLTIVAGGSGATVDGVTSTGIQVRAQPLTVLSETVVQNATDASASIERYSPIPGQDIPLTLSVGGWPEIDVPNARAVCDAWVLRYMWPRPYVTFTLRNGNGLALERILKSRISDRLTLIQAITGMDADVWINQMSLVVSGFQGRSIALVVGAEKCDLLSGAIWDESLWNNPSSLWGV